MAKYFFSPSALSVFRDCPRCFWLEKKAGVKRPRGIFPSLPGGMDRILKPYYDGFREKDILPPELCDIKGKLFPNVKQLNAWRNWQTGLQVNIPEANVILSGAIDELLVTDKGLHIITDYKTRGSVPKNDGSQYYQNQLDSYALMLQANGMPIANYGILAYYWPATVKSKDEESIDITFDVKIFKIPVDPFSAKKVCIDAAKCLDQTVAPLASLNCEYCKFIEDRGESK